ncbi:methylated-DNA-[protein]-cysteine S-methyltransferase [Propionibacterium cyclohexanicum]|uniref:Methylated-DNA--protein-cysteine methyltransferase n=1 Tax=Propionibacterium cyclohexanicum TaxID=64702 RepID=A0A1H9U0Y1_9ACTN|nr:methylated-DNA--[protein]-cysteine S-methyltransferase [Propionibacterium cyclohexanicum]SES03280.1 methylated-DNA-[protein]-cysteine S-methyltransferase [Propionibacterium cyclohexanicum]
MTQTTTDPKSPSTAQPARLNWTTMDSPVGTLLLIGSPRGLLRIGFECEDRDAVLAHLAVRTGAAAQEAPDGLASAITQLGEYFAGTRREFELDLDRSLSSGFRAQVQLALSTIGYGTTVSYRQLAQLAGNPRAVRAVGSACATNPLPIVVPCHRVVRSDGGLGGYAGGLTVKQMLLALEARIADPGPQARIAQETAHAPGPVSGA